MIWRDHASTVESKIANNVGPLHRAKQVLTDASVKAIYISYIQSSIFCKSDAYVLSSMKSEAKIWFKSMRPLLRVS